MITVFTAGIVAMQFVQSAPEAQTDAIAQPTASVAAGENGVLPDGSLAQHQTTVPEGYTVIGGVNGKSMDFARNNPSGKYILMGDITVKSFDTASDSGKTFSGIFDGNGYTVTVDAFQNGISDSFIGGLFACVSGTVRNVTVVAATFRAGTSAHYARAGILAGYVQGNANITNVRIRLEHSPDNYASSPDCNFYLYNSTAVGSDSKLALGGLFGASNGDITFQNITIDNRTTGNYGFAVHGWRKTGNVFVHSDGIYYVGGVVGTTDGGTIHANAITLTGDRFSNYTVDGGDTSGERYSQGFIGGILGYQNEGNIYVDGLNIAQPLQLGTNVRTSNVKWQNWSWDTACGVLIGYRDNGLTAQFSNAFFMQSAQTTKLIGNVGNVQGVIQYPDDTQLRFDSTSTVAFYNMQRVAPDSGELVHQIRVGSGVHTVSDVLMLQDKQQEETVWVSVPRSNDAMDGTNRGINLRESMVSHGTAELQSSYNWIAEETDAYTAIRTYDGQVPASASIVLSGPVNARIDDAYVADNPSANVGTIDMKLQTQKLQGYQQIVYQGATYLYDAANGRVFAPKQFVVNGVTRPWDMARNLRIRTTKRTVTVTMPTGAIRYGMTLDEVKAAFAPKYSTTVPDAVSSFTLSGYTPLQDNAGDTVELKISDIRMQDGKESNYEFLYQSQQAQIVPQVIDGTLSLADTIYSGAEKNVAFLLLSGTWHGQDTVQLVYEGNRIDANQTFRVRAELPSANYVWKNPSQMEKEFSIQPRPVEIRYAAGDRAEIEFRPDLRPDATQWFIAPKDVNGQPMELSFTFDKELPLPSTGEYTVTANIADQSGNYTTSPLALTLTVTKANVTIGESTLAKFKSYDAAALSQQQMQALFRVMLDGEPIGLALSCSVEGGLQILHAGSYRITAQLAPEAQDNYQAEEFTIDFEVRKSEMTLDDLQIGMPQSLVYDGQPKVVTATPQSGVWGQDSVHVSVLYDGKADAPKDYRETPYAITFTVDNADYAIAADAKIEMQITRASVHIAPQDMTTQYGQALPSFSAEVTGVPAGEQVAYELYVDAAERYLVGTYTIQVRIQDAPQHANYAITFDTAQWTVVRKPIVLSVVGELEVVYSGAPADLRLQYEGIVDGDDVQITLGTYVDAGEYTVEWTIKGADVAQYDITADKEYTLVILQATPSVTDIVVDPTEGLFDSSLMPSITCTSDVAGTISWDVDMLQAGEHPYGWTFVPQDTHNYTNVTGTYVLIAQADTLSEIRVSKMPNKTQYIAYEVFDRTGMEIEAIFASGRKRPITEYQEDLSPLTVDDTHVEITFRDCKTTVTVTVTKRLIAYPTFGAQDWVYNMAEQTVAVSASEYYTVSGNSATDAGTYTMRASLKDAVNCAWTDSSVADWEQQWTIRPYEVTIGLAQEDTIKRPYDTTEFTAYGDLFLAPNGLDGKPLVLATSVADGLQVLNAGTYVITAVLGEGMGNYTAAAVHVTYIIEVADSTVTPMVADGEYIDLMPMPAISTQDGDTPGTIAWEREYLSKDITVYVWVFTPTDTHNYKSATGEITLHVREAYVTHIVVTKQPDKTEYQAFEQFSTAGMEVTAYYDNNTNKVVVDYTTSAGEMHADMNEVVITFDGKQTTVSVTVHRIAPNVEVSIEDRPLFVNGVFPTITLVDGSTPGIVQWDEGQSLQEGTFVYTWTFVPTDSINYLNKAGEASLTATVPVVIGITIKQLPDKTQYIAFDMFDPTGIQVYSQYNDGNEYLLEADAYTFDATEMLVKRTQVTVTYADPMFADKEWTTQFDVVVNKYPVTPPDVRIEPLYYNGQEQSVYITENPEYYTYTGNTAKDAGKYRLCLTLVDPENMEWLSMAEQELYAEWEILPKRVYIGAAAESQRERVYDGSEFTQYDTLFVAPTDLQGNPLSLQYNVRNGKKIIDAGYYTVEATLTGDNPNYTAEKFPVQYIVRKAPGKPFDFDVQVGYQQLQVVTDYDGNAEYSLDNEHFKPLTDAPIWVAVQGEYTLYVRAAEQDNYLPSESVVWQGYITKDALLQYITATFTQEFGIASWLSYQHLVGMAAVAVGENAECDTRFAELTEQYQAWKTQTEDAVKQGLQLAGGVSGRGVSAAAAAAGVSGIAAVGAIAVASRRKTSGKQSRRRLYLAGIALICTVALLGVGLTACADKSATVDEALQLMSKAQTVTVEVYQDQNLVYRYDGATVTNDYLLDIVPSEWISNTSKSNGMTQADLQGGYQWENTDQKTVLKGTFADTSASLGKNWQGAQIELEADGGCNELKIATIKYHIAGGYQVVVTLQGTQK